MDRDFEEEYKISVSNVFWCLKQEYGIRTTTWPQCSVTKNSTKRRWSGIDGPSMAVRRRNFKEPCAYARNELVLVWSSV
jgi:hypothetical protein